jgi:hypothetical protein
VAVKRIVPTASDNKRQACSRHRAPDELSSSYGDQAACGSAADAMAFQRTAHGVCLLLVELHVDVKRIAARLHGQR